jgi:dihydropteroate synthase
MSLPRIYPLNLKNRNILNKEFNRIDVHPTGVDIMRDKFDFLTFKIKNLDNRAAAILKQDFLSIGGEAAVSGKVQWFELGNNDVFLAGTKKHFKQLSDKLKTQPFKLKEIGFQLEKYLKQTEKSKTVFGKRKENDTPLIMGILNVTPDSFFDGGKYDNLKNTLKSVEKMVESGVHIIDVGGESTRPGAQSVSLQEELNRVIPVIKEVAKLTDIAISVDTFKSEVANAALSEGATIVNDISFGTFDKNMFKTVAKHNGFYVGMHILGTPKTMQQNPSYNDVVFEIREYLRIQSEKAVENGIKGENIVVDPGIGFGKTDIHNLEILRNTESFASLGYPVLIGASRKSLIGRLLGLDVEKRLSPSIAIACYCALNNVSVLRVHDVFETVFAVKMIKYLKDG